MVSEDYMGLICFCDPCFLNENLDNVSETIMTILWKLIKELYIGAFLKDYLLSLGKNTGNQ